MIGGGRINPITKLSATGGDNISTDLISCSCECNEFTKGLWNVCNTDEVCDCNAECKPIPSDLLNYPFIFNQGDGTLNAFGQGYCDNGDGGTFANLNCPTFDYDYGDCCQASCIAMSHWYCEDGNMDSPYLCAHSSNDGWLIDNTDTYGDTELGAYMCSPNGESDDYDCPSWDSVKNHLNE